MQMHSGLVSCSPCSVGLCLFPGIFLEQEFLRMQELSYTYVAVA